MPPFRLVFGKKRLRYGLTPLEGEVELFPAAVEEAGCEEELAEALAGGLSKESRAVRAGSIVGSTKEATGGGLEDAFAGSAVACFCSGELALGVTLGPEAVAAEFAALALDRVWRAGEASVDSTSLALRRLLDTAGDPREVAASSVEAAGEPLPTSSDAWFGFEDDARLEPSAASLAQFEEASAVEAGGLEDEISEASAITVSPSTVTATEISAELGSALASAALSS